MTTGTDRRAFRLREAAAAYGVSTDTIRRAIRSGALAAKRDGRGYLLHVDALDAWFHTHLTDA